MKIKERIIGVAAGYLCACLLSCNALAEDKMAKIDFNPYADCGIGVVPATKPNAIGVTSNVMWDGGVDANPPAPKDTVNCSSRNAYAARFIFDSYDSLAEETARGKGQYLVALMNIFNVPESNREAFIANLRIQMSEHLSAADFAAADKLHKANLYYLCVLSVLNAV